MYKIFLFKEYFCFLERMVYWASHWKGPLSVLIAAALPQPTPPSTQQYHYYRVYFERTQLLKVIKLFLSSLQNRQHLPSILSKGCNYSTLFIT